MKFCQGFASRNIRGYILRHMALKRPIAFAGFCDYGKGLPPAQAIWNNWKRYVDPT